MEPIPNYDVARCDPAADAFQPHSTSERVGLKGATASALADDASTRPQGERAASPPSRGGRGFLHVVGSDSGLQKNSDYSRMNCA